ncbi:MAG: CBS domain-containing protein [Bdellovibrionales bacterium]|nr:CBS domain-containing protein [Bdellovibrionales bacterium]
MDSIVQHVMTREPAYVETTSTVREALEKMYSMDIRHLPVLDGGELVGMLSDRDLRNLYIRPGEDRGTENINDVILDQPVSKLMSSNVLSVMPDTPISELIDLMIENKVGAVPVVDGEEGSLKGIVSYIDILRAARELF